MPWKPRPNAPKHAKERRGKHAQSTTERGYGWDWQQYRKQYLARNPLCKDCEAEGIVTPATEVHHVTKIRHDASKRLDGENLMGLCDRCHNRRTAKGE